MCRTELAIKERSVFRKVNEGEKLWKKAAVSFQI